MTVYKVEDAKAIKNREEEKSKIRAKVPSPFLVCSANPKINLEENFVKIETQFLSPFGSFFSKAIDFSLQPSVSQRLVLSLGSDETFVRGT
jgi:hypothetical protein